MKSVGWYFQALAMSFALPMAAVSAHDTHQHAGEASRIAAMGDTTRAFLATLDDKQRAAVAASLEDNDRRTNWSNLPVNMAPRAGLPVTDMNAAQRRALHAMLAAAFSSQGYLKTATIMWHEDVLRLLTDANAAKLPDNSEAKARALAFAPNYDAEKFHVTVFGDPQSPNWGWMLTGHHYAANFTVADGKVGFTPLFLGASPQIVPEGRFAGWRILQHEVDRAFAFVASLSDAQRSQAVVANAVDDKIFLGKGRQSKVAAPVGISAASLNPAQRRLLDELLAEFLENASNEASARQRAAIDSDGLEKLHFAWWGPAGDPAARYMFRVQGPSIIIDYIRERSPDGGYNHVHSIVRDPSNDYGAEWLKRHYQEAHQN